jgi:C-terminal processing protease CtpA/Prc
MSDRNDTLKKTLSATLALSLGVVPAASARTVKAPTSLPASGGVAVGNPAMNPSAGAAFAAPSLAIPSLSQGLGLPVLNDAVGITDSAAPSAAAAAAERTIAIRTAPARTAAPAAPLTGKNSAAVAKSIRATSVRAAAAIGETGPVADASPAAAHGLGGKLQALLTPGFRKGSAGGAVLAAPAARRFSGLGRAAALNAADEAGANANEVTRRAQLETLNFIANTFSGHYAMIDWKREKFGVELAELKAKAKRRIERGDPVLSTREFQDVIAEFVSGLKDYHVGIQFYSTEMSMMPFSVMEAKGKYFVTFVDPRVAAAVPFKVGDQIVEFDGQKTEDAVKELMREKGRNNLRTDKTLATMRLTRRNRQGGDRVPTGTARIKFASTDGRLQTAELPWVHMEELVPEDAPARDGGQLLQDFDPFNPDSAPRTEERRIQHPVLEAIKKIVPKMLNPIAALFRREATDPMADDPFAVGGRESFVPNLGEVIWQSPPMLPIKAYIYVDADGRHVGYIRIADYVQPEMVAELFGKIIEEFERKTDALVIDQVNNPGGSVFYLYALLSRLTDKPMKVPTQRILTSEEEAMQMSQILALEEMVTNDALAQQVLGPSMGGYPTTLKLFRKIVGYAKFILAELRAGRRLTNETAMMGVDEIDPHETQRYTKPIMVLVNELDFSSADFFPAILQDNGRATIFGTRTAGAGGAVRPMQFPNQFGIAMLAYTWTIAMRTIGQPIENLAVTPDTPYALTPEDLQNGFEGYKRAVNKKMDSLLKDVPARAIEQSILAPRETENPAEGPADDVRGEESGPTTSGPADPQ